ncbi:MAG TPA: hypothetical protein VFE05_22915, partial [Longimicrobiaceae bacterium]|nr:hypothetical protein [Longimicrobiaceae bacterium]
ARAAAATRVELRLEGVHVARNPGVLYHVFVNLPANEADRALRNAAADGHYVGTIDFFEIVSHQHGGGAGYDVALDLGPEAPVLRRAVAAGDVTVTFVPEGLELPGGRRMPPQATVQMARVVLRSVPAGR